MSHRSSTIALACLLGLSLWGCRPDHPGDATAPASHVITIETLQREDRDAWSARLVDLDRDGQQDLILAGHRPRVSISYGQGNAFEPSSFKFPRGKDRHDCDAADVNGDGWPDLFCTRGGGRGEGAKANELWQNLDGTTFEKINQHGAEAPTARGRLVRFFNYNGDSMPDLYVTNYRGNESQPAGEANQVFVNEGGTFAAVENELLNQHWGSACLDVADINGDGIDDLVVCDTHKPPQLFTSQGPGRYLASSPATNSKQQRVALFADATGDEVPDLLLVDTRGNLTLLVNQDGAFAGNSRSVLRAKGESDTRVHTTGRLAVADFNRDGVPDIYLGRHSSKLATQDQAGQAEQIFIGPDFAQQISVPPPETGFTAHLLAEPQAVLRISAGPTWPGQVDRVRLQAAAKGQQAP